MKYKFRYTTLVWILLGLVAILSTGGLALNIYKIIKYSHIEATKIVGFAGMGVIDLLLLVFVLSTMINGKYVIKANKNNDGGYIYVYIGFIRTKSNISDIVEITHFKKSNKLVCYFKDEKYSVIVISPDDFDNFIKDLREINPHIYYDERIDGEETPV